MKTATRCINQTLSVLMLAGAVLTSSADAGDDYQANVLFNPSPAILKAEAKGRIMIYDGLKNETVELAMNQQFERIENMMFVRTQYQQENGEYEVEDDCD